MICPECKHINNDKDLICSNCGCDLEQYKSEIKVNNKRIESSYYKSVSNDIFNNDFIVKAKKPIISPRIVLGTFSFIGVICFNLFSYFIIGDIDSVTILLSLIVLGCGIYFIKDGINDLKNVNKIYEENKNDKDYYDNLIKQYYESKYESERIVRQVIYDDLKPKKKTKPNIKCPYCGSNNTKKITFSSRAVSTTITGMASSKIGKQWHCNDCGSNF